MDKLTSMQVFTKVAKAGSFIGAAKELGISRAMATKHIMQLENTLGIRLFNRTTRRLNLTEVGTSYLERCLQILDELEEMELAVTSLQTEPRGVLKISSPPFFGTHHLTRAIADYVKNYPDVKFNLQLQGGVVDMIEEGLDLSIRLDELGDSSLIARRIARSRMVVCGSPSYLKEHGEPKVPEELQDHNCLVNWGLPPGDTWKFSKNNKESVIRVFGNLQSSVADAVRVAAVEGIGLTILPTYMIGRDLQTGKLQVVLSEFEGPLGNINIVYPHRKHLSAKVRTFVDFLCDRLQPLPYWDDWMEQK